MFSTSITRTFGLTTPIVNAGMAMIARPPLAAAVCEAGGLGTIGSDINPPHVLRDLIRQTNALTKRPFGVDLIGDFVTDEHVSVLIEEHVALAIFFWTLPTPEHVERLKQAGIEVWMQVGRVAEAEQAAALGADALIVQGAEAGGHNRAEASTMTLFRACADASPACRCLPQAASSMAPPWLPRSFSAPTPYGAAAVSSLPRGGGARRIQGSRAVRRCRRYGDPLHLRPRVARSGHACDRQ
jgi:NAD(P)H-dependent flavin oxidoreductase YrpB (nitropropane dioxygenase family)